MERVVRVLVACECSGMVRDALTEIGIHALSSDIHGCERPGHHFRGDVRLLLDGWEPVRFTGECDPEDEGTCCVTGFGTDSCACLGPTQEGMEYTNRKGVLLARPKERPYWDAIIAFPPCTYLCSSGMHWTVRGARDPALTEEAVQFVRRIWEAPTSTGIVVIENPVGILSSKIGLPLQYVQPYEYGHDAAKKTGLWVRGGLPKLQPTEPVAPRMVDGLPRWGNQTDSGQNRLGPSTKRAGLRARTYEGIAEAIASQWGPLIKKRARIMDSAR